jgi:hypothetical protein
VVHYQLFLFGNCRNRIPNANTVAKPHQNQQRGKIAAQIVSSSHKTQTPTITNSKTEKWATQEEKEGFVVWMDFNAWLMPHIQPLLKCFQKPPDVLVSCAKVFEVLWVEADWERVLQEFLLTHDPSRIMDSYNIISQTDNQEGSVTVPLQAALISSIEYPYCLSSTTTCSSIIIDYGTSVCITPHKLDFITYKDSKMKI